MAEPAATPTPDAPPTGGKLPRHQLLAFALPTVALGIMTAPVFFVLPAHYAKYTSATLAALGSVLIFSRIFDAVIDPFIGYLSDCTRTRIGGRKPWMLAACVLLAISVYHLFTPEASSGVAYFLVWSVVFYLAWTMFDLPQAAWLAEMTGDYRERSRVGAYLGVALQLGGFLFFAASYTGLFASTDITPEFLRAMAWAAAITLPLAMLIAAWLVPHGAPVTVERTRPRGVWDSVRRNPALKWLLGAQLLGGMGGGLFLTTYIILLDSHFGMRDKFGLLYLVYTATHFAGLPIWLRIVYRFGKHRSWAVSWALGAAFFPVMLLIPRGPEALVPLIVFGIVRSLLSGADMVVPKALMADAVDYGVWKSGANPAGSYFAFSSLAVTTCAAISSGLAFYLLAAFGFDPKEGATNEGLAHFGLLFVSLFLPALFNVAASFCVWMFPIDARRQAILRRRIEQRAERSARVDPSAIALASQRELAAS